MKITEKQADAIYQNWKGRTERLQAVVDNPDRDWWDRSRAFLLWLKMVERTLRFVSLHNMKRIAARAKSSDNFPPGGIIAKGEPDGGEYFIRPK